ncbi:C-X-C chemokine receptor type 1 [Mugil cephalus]|uniref:C-X-C chemokine receptor type 1 n=1 Tax=Mugil cephalus TaxID=48193 RepID=UPI001FB73AFB|nr:C-X-C chemokine receptor type 1 [Mugil cephalus]
MKLQLFIFSVLKYLVMTSQAEEENQVTTTEEFDFNELFSSGSTFEDASSIPCDVKPPALNSTGLMVAYMIVFVFGIIGNSIVVCVVCHMKKRKVSTDIYLMNLAIADLLFCLTLPFSAVDVHFGWIFGDFLCKVLSGFQEASVYSGVFLLACISVDRYFAIVRATRLLSTRHLLVKGVCTVVWLVAGLLSIPVVIKKESMYAEDLDQLICYENLTGESGNHWKVSIRIMRHTLGFFLPLLVMAVCYGWTAMALFHIRNQQKHKAMRVILAVVLAFIVCWLPYNITVLIDSLIRGGSLKVDSCDSRNRVEVIRNVTEVLAFMHCAVNPILYAFIGQKFRNQLLDTLYKQGLISKRLHIAYRTSEVNSLGSMRSRNTSASTM